MKPEDRRQTPRFAASIPASVTTRGGETFSCEIIDVGGAGCQIRLSEPARLGDRVTLTIEGEDTLARVIWARGDCAGLWFPNAVEHAPPESFMRRTWRRLFEGGSR
jgi:hypothetical protein